MSGFFVYCVCFGCGLVVVKLLCWLVIWLRMNCVGVLCLLSVFLVLRRCVSFMSKKVVLFWVSLSWFVVLLLMVFWYNSCILVVWMMWCSIFCLWFLLCFMVVLVVIRLNVCWLCVKFVCLCGSVMLRVVYWFRILMNFFRKCCCNLMFRLMSFLCSVYRMSWLVRWLRCWVLIMMCLFWIWLNLRVGSVFWLVI